MKAQRAWENLPGDCHISEVAREKLGNLSHIRAQTWKHREVRYLPKMTKIFRSGCTECSGNLLKITRVEKMWKQRGCKLPKMT